MDLPFYNESFSSLFDCNEHLDNTPDDCNYDYSDVNSVNNIPLSYSQSHGINIDNANVSDNGSNNLNIAKVLPLYIPFSINDFNPSCDIQDLDNHFQDMQNECIKILHINIRSLSQNYIKLNILINNLKHKPDVITLSETWIPANQTKLFPMDGYDLHLSPRIGKKRRWSRCVYSTKT